MMVVLSCYLLPLCILVGFPLAYLESGGRLKGLLPVTLCAAMAAYGFFAFFAPGGGLKFVGESFEWPMATTVGAVENARGQRFVPLTAPGRIQAYGPEGEFERGWFIPAFGGGFKLHVTASDDLEVFTVRGDRHLVFAADGTLLSNDLYREDYAQLPTGPDCRVDRGYTWYLWPLAHPWLAMLPSCAGLAGLMVLLNSDKLRTLRPIYRRSTTMVPSDEFGQFSFAVGMMQGPPYAVIESDHSHKLDSPTGLQDGRQAMLRD